MEKDNLKIVGEKEKKAVESKSDSVNDSVTVPKAEWERINDMVNRLMFSADKKQLARYDDLHRGEQDFVTKLIVIDDKVVKSWGKMKDNIVEKNAQGWWKEEQTIELEFMDGTKKEMKYLDFVKGYTHIPAKVIKENKEEKLVKDREGKIISRYLVVTLNVKTFDGVEYTIDSTFVN
jgi:hypothetical protein